MHPNPTSPPLPPPPSSPTRSPLISRRYAMLCLAQVVGILTVAIGVPLLAYWRWNRFCELRNPEFYALFFGYLALVTYSFVRGSAFSRDYLKRKLLAALAQQGRAIDTKDAWHFVDLIHPAIPRNNLDTAYAVGFLRIEGGSGSDAPERSEGRLILESDVERWQLRASQVLNVEFNAANNFAPIIIRYQIPGENTPREVRVSDREHSNGFVMRLFNRRLFTRIAAAVDPDALRNAGKRGRDVPPAAVSIPQVFEQTTPFGPGAKLVCDESGPHLYRRNKLVWEAAWRDVLDVWRKHTEATSFLVLRTADKPLHIPSTLPSRKIAPVLEAGMEPWEQTLAQQDELTFESPAYELRAVRNQFWTISAGAAGMCAAFAFILARFSARALDFAQRFPDSPLVPVMRGALLVGAGMFASLLAPAITALLYAWRGWRVARRSAKVRLDRSQIAIASPAGMSAVVPFRRIREIVVFPRWLELRMVDGNRVRIGSTLGRYRFFRRQLLERLESAGFQAPERKYRISYGVWIALSHVHCAHRSLGLGVLHELGQAGMDWHEIFKH